MARYLRRLVHCPPCALSSSAQRCFAPSSRIAQRGAVPHCEARARRALSAAPAAQAVGVRTALLMDQHEGFISPHVFGDVNFAFGDTEVDHFTDLLLFEGAQLASRNGGVMRTMHPDAGAPNRALRQPAFSRMAPPSLAQSCLSLSPCMRRVRARASLDRMPHSWKSLSRSRLSRCC